MNNLSKCRVFKISKVRITNPTRAGQVPNILELDTNLLSMAKASLEASRQAVEKLLNSIPLDDHYAFGILGPILVTLRDAERDFGSI